MILDKLIVMNGHGDSQKLGKSEEFAKFLTVSRKYGLTCVCIFHTIYPTRQIWQMIMWQTEIFNFFLGSVYPSSIIRILSSFVSRYKNTFTPHRNLWINWLYFKIYNFRQTQCLAIDTRDINDLGPARTQADSCTEQICYYNGNKKDTSFNSLLAVRKKTSSPVEINFSIVNVIDSTNRHNNIYSEISIFWN